MHFIHIIIGILWTPNYLSVNAHLMKQKWLFHTSNRVKLARFSFVIFISFFHADDINTSQLFHLPFLGNISFVAFQNSPYLSWILAQKKLKIYVHELDFSIFADSKNLKIKFVWRIRNAQNITELYKCGSRFVYCKHLHCHQTHC